MHLGFVRQTLTICLLAIAAAFAVAPVEGMAQDRTAVLVDQMIAGIDSVESPEKRVTRAEDFAMVIHYLSEEGKLQAAIDDAAIDALADLLRDDIEAEDFSVAGALGLIGPRASRAVPALEAAHATACAEMNSLPFSTGIHDVDAFELALERITGTAPDCRGLKLLQQ